MSNPRKLVYLLPEVCFVAELVPSKKPHAYAIQTFRQINGQFMEDDDVVTENLIKLFKKLEPDTYSLILPDFLFTNTIIDVAATSEDEVRQYLLEKLLPSLGLSKQTHQLETFILTQHQKKTKVQLSGLEKSILGPVFPIATERGVIIDGIYPLSWTLKSIVSLEPSLSAVEMGKHLYMAQHYIGVDQSVFFLSENVANMVDSVRTLQGAEPNLQTLYLLTSPETEQKLKSVIKQKIPVQQLAEVESSVEGLPAHIKTAIEAAAKTLDITDYPVPKFSLEAYVSPKEDTKAEEAPAAPSITQEPVPAPPTPKPLILEESLSDDDKPESAPTLPTAPSLSTTQPTVTEEIIVEVTEEPVAPEPTQFVTKPDSVSPSTPEESEADWVGDIAETETEGETDMPIDQEPTVGEQPEPRQRPVIKNRTSNGSMMKMIGITLAALLVTVASGVGIGFGLMKASEKGAPVNQTLTPSPKSTPVVQVTTPPATPATATASGSSTSAPLTADKSKLKVLVVNATGVSGVAGKMKSTLTTAGYKTIETGNAKGKYEKGNFILLEKENSEIVAQFQKDSKTTVSAGTEKKTTEDPKGIYDVVFVINAQ